MLVDRNAINDIRPEFLQQHAAQAQQPIRNPWIRRLLGVPNFNYQSSTIIVQRLTIPVGTNMANSSLAFTFLAFLKARHRRNY